MEEQFIDQLIRELMTCREASSYQGWIDEEYNYTAADLREVIRAVGRTPTREEWHAAGLRWVGEAHCSSCDPDEVEIGDSDEVDDE
jgi:hypothetical protein